MKTTEIKEKLIGSLNTTCGLDSYEIILVNAVKKEAIVRMKYSWTPFTNDYLLKLRPEQPYIIHESTNLTLHI